MIKKILVILIGCIATVAMAQCPPGNIILETQADVDAFQSNYPNCTQILGDLYLGSYSTSSFSNINNLNALNGITSIAGRLQISQVDQLIDLSDLINLNSLDSLWISQSYLSSLNGLQNLTALENLRLFNNHTSDFSALNHLSSLNQLRIAFDEVLVDLSGFDHFTNINFIDINNNRQLTSINAFQNLTGVPPFTTPSIQIDDNLVLTSLNAFQNVQVLSNLEINGNPMLSSINDFSNLIQVNRIRIYDNGLISMNNAFSSLTTINSLLTIGNNFSMTSFDDFNALTSIQSITFINNNSLQSLTGFNNLINVNSVNVSSNLALTQFNTFQNIRPLQYLNISNHPVLNDINAVTNADFTLLNSLRIVDNDLISTCNLTSICQYINSNNANAEIRDNAPGCNSPLEVATGCNLNIISGTAYYDLNGNNIFDSSDLPVQNIKITSDNGTDTFTTYTRQNGSYDNFTDDGAINTTIDAVSNFSFAPASHSSNFSGVGNQDVHKNFEGSISNAFNDVSVQIIPTNAARPGFEARYRLILKNEGTQNSSGVVTVNYDATKLTFNSSSVTAINQTAGLITFNYNNLNLFETRIIQIQYDVALPPTLIGGEILDFNAQITPSITDVDATNNNDVLSQTVVNSYDPNDKTVFEGNEILPNQLNEYLHYLIRFQNTGTASAIHVKVTDTLSSNLDWDTFEPINMSHDVGEVHIRNKRFIDFDFPNINLPDSTANEALSHGYIYYRIKPKQNIVIGDQMENTAHIFFDFNEAIVTNTTVTTLVQTLSGNDEEPLGISIYPNPVKETLVLKTDKEIDSISIYNLQGQELIKTNSKNINVNNLNSGIYLITIHSNSQSQSLKFIKN
ncbi:MAG: T9SS type A sorting domain-containing protein [Nonlabens ulvanivorans]|uniref:DUF7619 domain-containing protein n=6 Tax=Nonlabens ulvanivorans TaxID=906888 RepID=UPI003263C951